MALVNARLSERSFRGWNRARGLARRILSSFDSCLAQDEGVAKRLTALGALSVEIAGSLKADAPVLPVDEGALTIFRAAIGVRPIFLAASTHPGEEEIVMGVAGALRKDGSDALTIIVPRHPARGDEIEALAKAHGFAVSRRSTGELPSTDTQVYVADTMGELGLFYRATPFAFLGGSLVPHGGQNPLEAARLGSAVVTGPHTHNFEDIFVSLLAAQGDGRVHSSEELSRLVQKLIADPATAEQLGACAKSASDCLKGALSATIMMAETLITHART
jgi:3-deoxy-D-manno-octulosonic-acid transferase